MQVTADFENARKYCLNKLINELPAGLTYHSLKHTIAEVVPAADWLATLEKVSGEDRLLLLTAAYYHDVGFIRQRRRHESSSMDIVKEVLPTFGYANAQVGVICRIIQATCIPQAPTTLLECIMADADLDYLGQEVFWERSNDLRMELENYGEKFTDRDWLIYQEIFIKAHHYFTQSQRSLRDEAKQQHLQEIQTRLAALV